MILFRLGLTYVIFIVMTCARFAAAQSVTEYIVSTGQSEPVGIAVGPDAAIWFTEAQGNKIGRVITSGTFTEYPVPTPNSGSVGITAGPDGALWFTEKLGNKIRRIT